MGPTASQSVALFSIKGQLDIVENLHVYNISVFDTSDGARIKIWLDVLPNTTGSEAGGGLGHVQNVIFEKYENKNNDHRLSSTNFFRVNS
ncbi:exopolygalacturonase A [Colletotrichum spaethianum]|uniref:Exopolygalacturonase A n=1 Tax=Colletotrichum spaethianum TaxID=700344 RepID=A0AA37UPX1_9PEZI|nr:exopolygalacturonase A [Colletotrichum spaethianum]GKT47777.1 exopolygalacturonase A [Colletotrichum spaethianum]